MRERKLELTEELKSFIADLEVFANKWVDEVNNVILVHLEELYQDKTVRHILKLYADDVRRKVRWDEGYLLSAYLNDTLVNGYRHNIMHDYSDVLYELCYRRYADKKGDE